MQDFTTHRRIEFADTDVSGIVHFSRFFVFMETAEHEMRSALGFEVHAEQDGRVIGWPRVAASCDYRSPLRFGDRLEIRGRIERMGKTSLTFHFEMYTADRLVAEGQLTSVCCALGGGKLEIRPIPSALSERIGEIPEGTSS